MTQDCLHGWIDLLIPPAYPMYSSSNLQPPCIMKWLGIACMVGLIHWSHLQILCSPSWQSPSIVKWLRIDCLMVGLGHGAYWKAGLNFGLDFVKCINFIYWGKTLPEAKIHQGPFTHAICDAISSTKRAIPWCFFAKHHVNWKIYDITFEGTPLSNSC